jgi:hypothetical protein
MTWVVSYLAIALAGLVMVGCFAVWLWRKAVALLCELGVLLERVDELADLVGQVGEPVSAHRPQGLHRIVDDDGADKDEVEVDSTRRQAT